jgi:hypothetical protein
VKETKNLIETKKEWALPFPLPVQSDSVSSPVNFNVVKKKTKHKEDNTQQQQIKQNSKKKLK